eukprot:EG_transcript_11972
MEPEPMPDRVVLLRSIVARDGEQTIAPFRPGLQEKFSLLEGSRQEETIVFEVPQDAVSNLRRRITTFKMGMQVDRREQPMGTFAGGGQEHSFRFPENVVPTGWHVRGQYRCTMEYLDDRGLCCGPIERQFAIVKK